MKLEPNTKLETTLIKEQSPTDLFFEQQMQEYEFARQLPALLAITEFFLGVGKFPATFQMNGETVNSKDYLHQCVKVIQYLRK